eukprot:COSAG05_NODE_1387_length_5007_cov_322.307253_4_plen_51_part_00
MLSYCAQRGGLVELPSAERAGLLFIVPTVVPVEQFEAMLLQTVSLRCLFG